MNTPRYDGLRPSAGDTRRAVAQSVLCEGWPAARVIHRHLRYAQALVSDSIGFRPLDSSRDEDVAWLLHAIIDGGAGPLTLDTDLAAIVANHADQTIVGGLLISATVLPHGCVAVIRHLAVDPGWRGRGIGLVLLGVLPQLSQNTPPALTFGHCAEQDAGYYQRAGFTVLPPAVPLPKQLAEHVPPTSTSPHQPCWIYRTW